jgi:hypothetical protein
MVDFNPENYEQNPLKKYFRQAKVHITLPSKGKFYPDGALDMPETGELPVYPMTAKDELVIKTPDALLNGSATVEIIKSCVPAIRDPWKMPSIDLDAVLVAIRIATYGEKLKLDINTPVTGSEKTVEADLRQILNKLVTVEFDNVVQIQDMTVELRPLTYKEFTESNLKTFEEQRVFALVTNETLSESEKLEKFNESFTKLTDLTVTMMSRSIASITIGDTVVTNQKHIDEFINNVDKEWFEHVTDHLNEQRDKFSIEPLKVQTDPEDVEKGAPETFEVPVTFDQSNFFE